MKKALIILLFAATTSLCFGFNPLVRNFSKDSYMGGSQTWDIIQDPAGNVYFANNSGVLQYDGRKWTLVRLRNNSFARSLFFDTAENKLYVGGTNELASISVSDEGIVYKPLLDSEEDFVEEIWEIRKNALGQIEFDGQNARYTLDGASLRKEEMSSRVTGDIFCTARNSRYYAEGTTSDGVYIHDVKSGEVFHLSTDNGLQNNTVLSMCFDSSGGLWLGLDKGIDYVMMGTPIYRLFGDPDSFGTGYASAIYEGYLYVGTNTGVFRIRESLLSGDYSDSDFRRVGGISGQVWELQVLDGKLFCCQDKGIYIISADGTLSKHIPLPGCWKLEAMEDGSPDHILGCSYERFFILVNKGCKWEFGNYLPGFSEAGKAFYRDFDGKVWFGHHVKGLYRFSLNEDFTDVLELSHLGISEGFPEESGNYPFIHRGNILFATPEGFYRFDEFDGKARPADEFNALFTDLELNTLMFFETPDRKAKCYWSGDILAVEYISGDGGRKLDKYTFQHLAARRPRGFSSSLSIDGDKILLNSEDGFNVLDIGRLADSRADDKLPSVYIKSISLENGNGSVYNSIAWEDSPEIKLGYKQNSLDIDFIEPYFSATDAVEYSCALEGYDDGFSAYSTDNSRAYYKLRPGRYTFTVRAHNRHMAGRISSASAVIVIARPWFQSWWAAIVYVFACLGVLWGAYLFIKHLTNKRAFKIAAGKAEEMRKAQIRKDLQNKADELAASTMNLQRKNEILQKIGSKVDDAVESAKNGDPVEVRLRRLRSISELIQENITHDTDWQKFQDNFDVVYDDFLKRLGEGYPGLNVSDKRICAYLRMGLSSKDIAPLLGMTVRSVEMTRYRLRKKLGLGRESNLSEFLQRY